MSIVWMFGEMLVAIVSIVGAGAAIFVWALILGGM